MNETTQITTAIRYKQSHLAGRGWSGQKMNGINAGDSNKKGISVRKKSCGEIMNANLLAWWHFSIKPKEFFMLPYVYRQKRTLLKTASWSNKYHGLIALTRSFAIV